MTNERECECVNYGITTSKLPSATFEKVVWTKEELIEVITDTIEKLNIYDICGRYYLPRCISDTTPIPQHVIDNILKEEEFEIPSFMNR